MKTYPAFAVHYPEGGVCAMFEAGAADRHNFRMVYGFARAEARAVGGSVEIFRAPRDPKQACA